MGQGGCDWFGFAVDVGVSGFFSTFASAKSESFPSEQTHCINDTDLNAGKPSREVAFLPAVQELLK